MLQNRKYSLPCKNWNLYQEEFNQLKDKLHRRNMQIKELKKHSIGKLSINDITKNAIEFLTSQGYDIKGISRTV